MKTRAELMIEFPSIPAAQAARKALEESEFKGNRTRCRVEKKDHTVLISVEAEDTVALRAMVNSYLRHAQLIEGTNKEE